MIFEVTRASDMFSTKKPYEKCLEIDWVKTEKVPYKSFEEYNEKSGMKLKWTQRGTNHRVLEDGYIARDMGTEKVYAIEINSLEELIALKNEIKYDIIICDSKVENIKYCIKICDDYLD